MASSQSPYEYYLELLGKWSTGVALPTLWFCTFDLSSINCLKSNVSTALNNYEATLGNSGWSISQSTVKKLTSSGLQYQSNSYMGCVFAKQVDTPSDSINASHSGLDYSGYVAPITTNGRQALPELSITFLETNASFIDLVIRPWLVLTSYNGCVARSKNSAKAVKCRYCDMCMLAKAGSGNSLAIRKIFRFFNVVPNQIMGESYSHAPDALKTTQVNFLYDGYTVLEQETKSYVTK
jgi:hypothetical protein